MAEDDPVENFRELVEFLEARVCSRAEFNQFLQDDPVFFCLEINSSSTLPARHFVTGVKATERLQTLVAALRVRASENKKETS